ncbi:unnamed protein product [Cuscuta europaea]|uniref:Uncharacterized protein n=1 Tax=Cuscuta europaea TaxID=41803 RepID=A0A9P1DVU1_CUSEU|nr:unnamed protein product [Cuscuta europaea]
MSASLPRAMELKRLLSNIKKKSNQSMDHYLRDIKNLVDALASINSPVTEKAILQSTLQGLGPEYQFVTGTISLYPDSFPPDILHPRLMEAEQTVLHQHQDYSSPHQAFAAPLGTGQPGSSAPRGRGGCGRGGRVRGGRGRGGRNCRSSITHHQLLRCTPANPGRDLQGVLLSRDLLMTLLVNLLCPL